MNLFLQSYPNHGAFWAMLVTVKSKIAILKSTYSLALGFRRIDALVRELNYIR
jgi:hypothetical protein